MVRPSGSITAEMPVLAARTSGNPLSIARSRACSRCWYGPVLMPNQPSLVRLTSQPGRSPGGISSPGKMIS